MIAVLRREWIRIQHSGTAPFLICACLLIGVYSLFVRGAWVHTIAGDGAAQGFFPDPAYEGVDSDLLCAVAPLAHALFFPVVAVIIAAKACDSLRCCPANMISRAKGISMEGVLAVRATILTLILVGSFTIYSILYFIFEPMLFNVEIVSGAAGEFARRLFLASILCASYVVSVVSIISAFGNEPLVLGIVLAVSYVGYLLKFFIPSLLLPLHIPYLMVVCGPADITGYIAEIIAFSGVCIAASLSIALVAIKIHELA